MIFPKKAEATGCTAQPTSNPFATEINISPNQNADVTVIAHGDVRHWYAEVDPPNPSGPYDLGISQNGQWTLNFSVPGSFFTSTTGSQLLRIYNIDNGGNRETCSPALSVNVSGTPPSTNDPNCSINFTSGAPSSSRTINKGESLQISITGAPTPGDLYIIKSNGNIVAQADYTHDFNINFPDGGTFSLEAWHQISAGQTQKCGGGAITVIVSGTGNCSVVFTAINSSGLHYKLNADVTGTYEVRLNSKINGTWGTRDLKQIDFALGVSALSVLEGVFVKNLFLDGADSYRVLAKRLDPNPVDCDDPGEFKPTDAQLSGTEPGVNPCSGGSCPTAIGNLGSDITGLAQSILTIGTGLAGGIALIFMVIGSIRILTSSGDQQRLNAGREIMIAAISGLLFIILSVLILRFIGINVLNLEGFL